MAYLEPAEYLTYGLSADTADSWVQAASAMIDAHCRLSGLAGASYTELLRVQSPYGTVQLTYGPVQQITAVQVRYAPRKPQADGMLASCAVLFGLPGQWVDVDPSTVLAEANGQAALPCNLFGIPYTQAKVSYTAGYAIVPGAVKTACAQIVKNAQATPGLNVKSTQLDSIRTQYFSDSLLDEQVKCLLRPFVAERMG